MVFRGFEVDRAHPAVLALADQPAAPVPSSLGLRRFPLEPPLEATALEGRGFPSGDDAPGAPAPVEPPVGDLPPP